jgi:hypothetical protein
MEAMRTAARKYSFMKEANAVKSPKFDKLKNEIFDFVNNNFYPAETDETIDDYLFYIDKTQWRVRYDRGIKCWMLFVGDELVINKYDEDGDYYITAGGSVGKWRSYPEPERFAKELNDECRQVVDALITVKTEQESGARKIVYPKEEMYGRISRRDYYSGMSEEQRQTCWALKFSEVDIRYIDKEPVIAPLTAGEYFRLCRIYYLTNPTRYHDVPDDPKEAYLRFADMRHDGLDEVDPDDPQDFYDWLKKRGRWEGRQELGHSCEISSKTFLYPQFIDGLNGYYLWRGFIWNYDEVVTFCREPNLMLSGKEYLVEIIRGNGMLEVTPGNNRYGYPNKEFQEPVYYKNLTRKQKNKIAWDELKESEIKRKQS